MWTSETLATAGIICFLLPVIIPILLLMLFPVSEEEKERMRRRNEQFANSRSLSSPSSTFGEQMRAYSEAKLERRIEESEKRKPEPGWGTLLLGLDRYDDDGNYIPPK